MEPGDSFLELTTSLRGLICPLAIYCPPVTFGISILASMHSPHVIRSNGGTIAVVAEGSCRESYDVLKVH